MVEGVELTRREAAADGRATAGHDTGAGAFQVQTQTTVASQAIDSHLIS